MFHSGYSSDDLFQADVESPWSSPCIIESQKLGECWDEQLADRLTPEDDPPGTSYYDVSSFVCPRSVGYIIPSLSDHTMMGEVRVFEEIITTSEDDHFKSLQDGENS